MTAGTVFFALVGIAIQGNLPPADPETLGRQLTSAQQAAARAHQHLRAIMYSSGACAADIGTSIMEARTAAARLREARRALLSAAVDRLEPAGASRLSAGGANVWLDYISLIRGEAEALERFSQTGGEEDSFQVRVEALRGRLTVSAIPPKAADPFPRAAAEPADQTALILQALTADLDSEAESFESYISAVAAEHARSCGATPPSRGPFRVPGQSAAGRK